MIKLNSPQAWPTFQYCPCSCLQIPQILCHPPPGLSLFTLICLTFTTRLCPVNASIPYITNVPERCARTMVQGKVMTGIVLGFRTDTLLYLGDMRQPVATTEYVNNAMLLQCSYWDFTAKRTLCCVIFYNVLPFSYQFWNDTTGFWSLTPWGDKPCVVLSVSVAKQLSITVKETSACGGC